MYPSLACLMFNSRHRRNSALRSICSKIKILLQKKKEMDNVRGDDTDHISRMPNEILVQILTLLPSEEAVLMSIVSKRWKSVWVEFPILDLDFISFSKRYDKLSLEDRKCMFLELLEYVFFHSEIKKFHKLRLGFDMFVFRVDSHQIRQFIKFAMVSNCSALDLDFSNKPEGLIQRSTYTLPQSSFRNESLTELKLSNCKFISSMYEDFVSLKTAIMKKVVLLGDSVYHFISNSPCLEELQLIECPISPFLCLHHPRSKLKSFVLELCYNGKDDVKWIEINIPSLSQFKFAGILPQHFSIITGENLIEAELDLHDHEFQEMHLKDILKNLSRVKILTLCSSCIELLSANGVIVMPITFKNLRHLMIKPCPEDSGSLNISGLLRSAPYLETLSIHFDQVLEFEDYIKFNDDDETIWKPDFLPPNFVSHLKKVEIRGFYGEANEMELVKLMPKSSLSLEKMVIYKEDMKSRLEIVKKRGDENRVKILQRQQEKSIEDLLSFARGSSVAQVILK